MWLRTRRRIKYLILTNRKCTFVFGATIGAVLAVILHTILSISPLIFIASVWPADDLNLEKNVLNYETGAINYNFAYEKWLKNNHKLTSCPLNPDILRYTNQTNFENCGNVGNFEKTLLDNFIRDSDHFDPRTEAKFLFNKVSLNNT